MDSASMEAKTTPSLKPYYEHGGIVVYHGDCRDILARLEPASVQCCVTSPPYWGLRDYGIPPSVWGGDPECEHEFDYERTRRLRGSVGAKSTIDGDQSRAGNRLETIRNGSFCHCGAWLGNLGLEPTPDLFVEHIVEVFEAVRRVLKDDGTLWLNLGDCYATGAGKVGDSPGGGQQGERWKGNRGSHNSNNAGKAAYRLETVGPMTQPNRMPIPGLKPKDLVGIPWLCAFALRAAGWYLRSDIIWHKPNPMPESVTDRPTKAHEYIFLLSKSQRYYYDAEAIKEAMEAGSLERYEYAFGGAKSEALVEANKDGIGQRTRPVGDRETDGKRNKRTVWRVPTSPTPEAHFATFPPKLIEPCILAGCPEGGVVLDPFSGSGTTAMVCKDLGRRFVGAELNPEYIAIAERRIGRQEVLF